MSKDFVRTLGFMDNKKCSACEMMAWYQIGKYCFCDAHMTILVRKLDDEYER